MSVETVCAGLGATPRRYSLRILGDEMPVRLGFILCAHVQKGSTLVVRWFQSYLVLRRLTVGLKNADGDVIPEVVKLLLVDNREAEIALLIHARKRRSERVFRRVVNRAYKARICEQLSRGPLPADKVDDCYVEAVARFYLAVPELDRKFWRIIKSYDRRRVLWKTLHLYSWVIAQHEDMTA